MDIKQIVNELKKPFLPSQHREREIRGGGRWFFVPWQDIRDRLDEVCPEWQVSYSQPGYLGDYCHITCTITIMGISRSAPGNAEIQLVSSRGKDMARGTPIERAIADAFKNAAEAWGVGRYLDNQEFVVNYMQSKGDGRAYKYWHENQQIESGARGREKPKQTQTQTQTFPHTPVDRKMLTQEIDSLCKRKNVTADLMGKFLGKFKVKSLTELSDEKLKEFRDRLQRWK